MVGQIIIMRCVRRGAGEARQVKQIRTSSLPKTLGMRQCFAEQSISTAFPGVIHWAQEFFKDSATLILKKLSGHKYECVMYHGFHKSPSSD